ncbi:metallophosphoesterase [Coleofasciculus sp. F4-SAH-05]|uniref:metallophosphoesterase n=1 Tax=Coleofasciculus sp. F4-SAH-05 TaxID=3069525 RepID=UPI0032FBBB09
MAWVFSGQLRVERITVAIANLPPSLQGTKLVQLTDLHYDGFRLSEAMLAEAIQVSNQAEPDLVLLTGDYITYQPEPIHQLVRRLKYLESRAGVYAVLGNHDIYHHQAKTTVTEALTQIGVRVLWNEIVYPLGKELALVGLADFWSREFNPAPVMNQIAPQIPRIVLSHNPDTAEPLQEWRIDLQLSGHTHGGQVVIPGFGPIALLLPILRRYVPRPLHKWIPFLRECYQVVDHWEWGQGMHQIGANCMYVNRGLGTYAPGRLFCPPEVTIITLARAKGTGNREQGMGKPVSLETGN